MSRPVTVKYGSFDFASDSGFPPPLVTISKEFQRDGAGRQIGSTVNISLEGKIFATGGAPAGSTNEVWSNERFSGLLSQESKLRDEFIDGKTLSIGCNSISKFDNIKINKYSANRTDNNWVTTIDYSIDLVSEIKASGYGIDSFLVRETQDDWTIEPIDEFLYTKFDKLSDLGFSNFPSSASTNFEKYPMYRITRTLGAIGKYQPSGSGALYNAREWVQYHTNQSEFNVKNIVNNLNLYNFVRNINKSEIEGSYKITDTWLAGANTVPYTETFVMDTSLDNSMVRTVEIKGTIKGLEPYNTGVSNDDYANVGLLNSGISPAIIDNFRSSSPYNNKFANAMSGYSGIKSTIYDRVASFITTTLKYPTGSEYNKLFNQNENTINPIPVSITEGLNPIEGSITYSYSYNNRPINAVTGSISEHLTINESNPIPIVASIFVLGRKLGPILQNLNTKTIATRRVNFEVVLPQSGLTGIAFPMDAYNQMIDIVDQFKPSDPAGNIAVVLKDETSDWNISENRLVKEKVWEYTRCS